MITNLPNLLTLSRILAIPALVAAFYLPPIWSHWTTFLLFSAAATTDYFDGYLARSMGLTSALGRFLDPIADKLLVVVTIVMLVAVDRVQDWHILPALIILCREIVISGLREFLAELRVSVPVSYLAKWKTTVQIIALGALLLDGGALAQLRPDLVGMILLWIAAGLTLVTGYDYLRVGLRHMTEMPADRPAAPGAGRGD